MTMSPSMSPLICVNTAAAAAAEKTICEASKEKKREKERVSFTPNFVKTRITFQLVDHLTHCFVLSFVSA